MKKGVTIKIHQVNCGDCISINYKNREGKPINLFIDAGYIGTFLRTLKKETNALLKRGERIDLFIITHIHDDHISGMKSFIEVFGDKDIVDEYWFNWVPEYLTEDTELQEDGKIGVKRAVTLREYLESKGKLQETSLTSGYNHILGDAKITVLSPSVAELKELEGEWAKLESDARKKAMKISSKGNDYKKSISELLENEYEEDTSVLNGSSISFLLELENGFKGLFLADGHPQEISKSIKKLLDERGEEFLQVDFVKLSHHGSKGNTSPELIKLIKCKDYSISSNGNNRHNIPNKETLARVVTHNKGENISLHFNHKEGLISMFNEEEKEEFGFNCVFNSVEFKY